jgi:hypothetical protein
MPMQQSPRPFAELGDAWKGCPRRRINRLRKVGVDVSKGFMPRTITEGVDVCCNSDKSPSESMHKI